MKGYNLFIGLGGTGYNVLMSIKEKLYKEHARTHFDEVRYRYFDSDKDNLSTKYMVENRAGEEIDINIRQTEFVDISLGETNMSDFIERNKDVKEFCDKYGKEYDDYVGEAFPGNGAGQIRMVGKLYLRKKYKDSLTKVSSALRELHNIQTNRRQTQIGQGNASREINVFIFGSLAGGTGSGTAIDLPFLLQKNGIVGSKDLNIWGYFADHSFFQSKPFTQNIRPNTFGALCELEYWRDNYKSSTFFPTQFNASPEKYYDQIYMMQNVTKTGVLNYEQMIDITSDAAIALVNHNTLSALSNRTAQAGFTMEKKPRILSSFGVSSIVLNRKKVIDYFIKKQISNQINYFLSPLKNSNDINEKVKNFINENHLNEGIGENANKINQLIEKLCPLDEEVHETLIKIKLGSVETGRDADLKIISRKNRYVDDLLRVIDEVIKENDDSNEVSQKLRVMKDTFLQQKGGLDIAKNFFRNIGNQWSKMKQELVIEVSKHKEDREKINVELNRLKTELPNLKTFLGRIDTKEQESSIRYYTKKTTDLRTENYNSLAKEIIQIKRKEAAIKYFDKLINIVGEFYRIEDEYSYGVISKLDRKLKDLIDNIATPLQQSETQAELGNIVSGNDVVIDNRIIKLLQSFIESEPITQENMLLDMVSLEDDILSRESIYSVIDEITNYLNNQFKEKYNSDDGSLSYAIFNEKEYSIERIIIKFLNDNDIKSVFGTVQINNQFLWRYNGMEFPHDSGSEESTDTTLVVFRQNIDELIKDIPLKEEEFLFNDVQTNLFGIFSDRNSIRYVDNNNPDRITFYLQEDMIPMFKLSNIEDLFILFNERISHNRFHYYTDNRIYNLNYTILPSKGDSIKWWTIANIMGFVKKSTRGYLIQTSKATSRDGMFVLVDSTQGKKDRRQAFNSFSSDEHYIQEIQEHFEVELSESKEKVKEMFIDYVKNIYTRKNTGKEESTLNQEEVALLNDEINLTVRMAVDDLEINRDDLICDNLTKRRISTILKAK